MNNQLNNNMQSNDSICNSTNNNNIKISYNIKDIENIKSTNNNEIILKNKNISNCENFIEKQNNEINKDNVEVKKTLFKNNDDIYENYKELTKEFNVFLENVLTSTGKIKNLIKKIDKQMYKNNLSIENKKNKSSMKDKGFAEEKIVPKQIQLFFNLEPETKMSRTKVGGLFQDYLKKNNLKGNIGEKNKIDKRIYKLDDNLAKLFEIGNEEKDKINACTSSKVKYPYGFNFHNYQTWIKKIYNEKKNL